MEKETVSPPQRAAAFRPLQEARRITDTPIHDAVEREWLARGRAVPRAPEPWTMRGPVSTDDLFLRA
ncbi:hypothetical protein AMK15_34655 [Streptomyces sp. MJM1172]|nr:hypothetical protein AMK15_34655 [Streptomyces sp. MJM1172]